MENIGGHVAHLLETGAPHEAIEQAALQLMHQRGLTAQEQRQQCQLHSQRQPHACPVQGSAAAVAAAMLPAAAWAAVAAAAAAA